MILPALRAAFSGLNGDMPAAIKSALINLGQSASFGRNVRAKVVLPAPLGPAIITTLGIISNYNPFERSLLY